MFKDTLNQREQNFLRAVPKKFLGCAICLVLLFSFFGFCPVSWADNPVQEIGQGTVAVSKGVAKGFWWTGKTLYKGLDYLAGELLRPIEPVTHWVTSKVGVTTVEHVSSS